MTTADVILGRDTELDAIRDFLERPTGGRARLLHGEPGIGKSTLWRACIALASKQGYVTLLTRPTESEAKFSYMGLVDLFEHVDDGVLDRLRPIPTRQPRTESRRPLKPLERPEGVGNSAPTHAAIPRYSVINPPTLLVRRISSMGTVVAPTSSASGGSRPIPRCGRCRL
jgi:hypothetical protein